MDVTAILPQGLTSLFREMIGRVGRVGQVGKSA